MTVETIIKIGRFTLGLDGGDYIVSDEESGYDIKIPRNDIEEVSLKDGLTIEQLAILVGAVMVNQFKGNKRVGRLWLPCGSVAEAIEEAVEISDRNYTYEEILKAFSEANPQTVDDYLKEPDGETITNLLLSL